eukprot:1158306-Pelagomonas_calceolata.AAC.3
MAAKVLSKREHCPLMGSSAGLSVCPFTGACSSSLLPRHVGACVAQRHRNCSCGLFLNEHTC